MLPIAQEKPSLDLLYSYLARETQESPQIADFTQEESGTFELLGTLHPWHSLHWGAVSNAPGF